MLPEATITHKRAPWLRLPCSYDERFSSASMMGGACPFRIGVYDSQASHPNGLHWHDAHEIGYVLEGSGLFVVEAQEFPFQRGQVFVVNGRDRHMAYADDAALFFNVHFHPDLLNDGSFPELHDAAQLPFATSNRQFPALLPAEHPCASGTVLFLQMIAAEHEARGLHWQLAVKGLLLQVVALLLRHFPTLDEPDSNRQRRRELLLRFGPVLRLIEQQLTQPPRLRELADAVGLSPSRFSALFHEATGASPVEYRNLRRVILAQRLLADQSLTVCHVAEQCGFDTVQQFNRVFRRVVGDTPSGYRNQIAQQPRPASPL